MSFTHRKRSIALPLAMLGMGVLGILAPQPGSAATTPARPVAAKPATARPAATGVSTLPGLRYLPAQPALIAAVQVSAVQNFLGMMTGGQAKEASGADAMAGMFQLLK